jgi:hypothetical protein
MKRLRYTVEGRVTPAADAALIIGDDDYVTEFLRSVIDTISIDLNVTVGGVTMFYAAWQDPAHWAEDWAHEHGPGFDPHEHLRQHVTDA